MVAVLNAHIQPDSAAGLARHGLRNMIVRAADIGGKPEIVLQPAQIKLTVPL